MTIVEPLPASGYGNANWTDYSNYWRETDAEWMQERMVLRYADATLRTTQYPNPKFGQITYNESALGPNLDRPEMYSKQHNKWVALLMLDNITSTRDDSGGVAMSHKGAAGKGVVFQPAQTVMDNPINVMGNVLYVDSDSVDIKTGSKLVKLTTDAAGLVSDSPISASALATGGALTAVSASISGSLTVPNITMSGTLTGATASFSGVLTGGTVNGSQGTIGGVLLQSSIANASGGVIASGSFVRGDANMGYWSHRNPSSGAISAPTVTVDGTYVRFRASNGMPWDRHDGNHTGGWVACVFTSDPGAANAPTGSILLT